MDPITTFFRNYWNAGIEILLISIACYRTYLFFRGTRGAKIATKLVTFFIVMTLISQLLNLMVISWLLRSLTAFIAIALVVIFQPELRRILGGLSRGRLFVSTAEKQKTIDVIIEAAFELSSRQIGALVAIERHTGSRRGIRSFAEGGVELDSKVSKELLLTIFSSKTPMHDGGVIISGDRLLAAGCTFPVSQRDDLDYTFGQRHRAGLGLSEELDVVAIVVSEQTGDISICGHGRIERGFRLGQLETRLSELLLQVDGQPEPSVERAHSRAEVGSLN
jgi:diadenylate cyclase